MEPILETSQLMKRYRGGFALRSLDMRVEAGDIYGLIGRNGAGKTTLIRLVCGLQRPTQGTYRLWGVRSDRPEIIAQRRRMAAIVETPSMYLDMNAAENIRQMQRILGRPRVGGEEALLRLVGLETAGRKKAGQFSLGMKQRLGIAMALVGDPDFLIMDEPTNGLDPQGVIELRELLLRLNREKRITLLISSHNLDELGRVATRYGFIDGGRMVKEVSAEEVHAACRRCAHIVVSDAAAMARTLDGLGIAYAVTAANEADVFGEWNLTAAFAALRAAGCDVLSLTERNETLESYYLNLLGGERHAEAAAG